MRFVSIVFCLLSLCSNAHAFSHGHMGPQQNADGFTVIPYTVTTSGTCGTSGATANGTCIYYVTPGGTDDNANCKGYLPPVTTTPATSCASVAFAVNSQIRSGKPDWILLQGGETFSALNTTAFFFGKGRSALEPVVVSNFPNQIPTVASDRAIIDMNGASVSVIFQTSTNTLQYVAFLGLHATQSSRDPRSGNYSIAGLAAPAGIFLSQVSRFGYLELDNDWIEFMGAVQIGGSGSPPLANGPLSIRHVVNQYAYASTNDGSQPINGLNNSNRICLGPEGLSSSILVEYTFLRYCGNWPFMQTGGTVTITNSSSTGVPAVVTWPAGLPPAGIPPQGAWVAFTTTGSLPTGITPYGTHKGCTSPQACYFVRNVGVAGPGTANLSLTAAGALINTSSAGSGTHTAIWMDPTPTNREHDQYFGEGWNGCASNCDTSPYPPTGPATIRNTIYAYASNVGAQTRNGGSVFNSFFFADPAGITCCQIASTVSYNVITEGYPINTPVTTSGQAIGIDIANYTCGSPATAACPSAFVGNGLPVPGASGTGILKNLIFNRSSHGGPTASPITLEPAGGQVGYNAPTTTNVEVTGNIMCSWTNGFGKPVNDGGSGNNVHDNLPASNTDTACSSIPGVIDPTVTLATYYASIGGPGGATADDFLDAASLKVLSENWHGNDAYRAPAINNYFRTNFGMANP